MLRKTGFFFDELCFWHSSGLSHVVTFPVGGWVQPPASNGHAESPETKRRMKSLMDVSGLSRSLHLRSAEPLDDEALKLVHTEEYLHRFKSMSDNGGGILEPSAPMGPGTYEIAKLSAGLAYAAVKSVLRGELDNAYSLSRPPGHHCLPDSAMGFCFLANIALAIENAKEKLGVGRVAVVDWDVHHGNGTQHIFWERDDVLTISLHQDGSYPEGYSGEEDIGVGKGEGFNINIPLMAGAGHNSYMYAMDSIVLPALKRYQPELIIVACGYDANAYDPLSRMQLHSNSYREMTRKIQQVADELCHGKLVMVHEGGYSEAYVPFCGLAVLEELSGVRTEVNDLSLEMIQLQQPRERFEVLQRQLIDEIRLRFNL
ncbi:histone deacetylase/AcuC/AphA family protein [Xenorhabdus mauleonii]|uniref:Acetoin utilization deacetylase AcuC n=1 Tax=Xenorhabdus mauleonii TaxID=351675 RepID=A0A1I3L9S2_9GAMM|nr:class II histone deacetylase [Xenorhabdus mauleonii]PHM44588.1 histone deacetylase/AcuC/AphA family protein [Xenorhabdus mauleonii]SFI81206.1 Acetoin utilization deacetylase AcuC [Xenorhabdus mauleonii]